MKYLSPEMEIVEFDETVLTLGLTSNNETDNENVEGGVDFPEL